MTLVIAGSIPLVGCLDIFGQDDGGDTVGEPRRGEDVDGEHGSGGTDGSGSGGTASGGTSPGGNGAGGIGAGETGGADGGTGAMPGSGGSSSGLTDWQQVALDAHNQVRALHCVPEMTWNEEAAAFAQEWAEGLCPSMSLMHSMGSGYGENLYMSWGGGGTPSLVDRAEAAVIGWYSEIEDYSYDSPGFSSGTGHFTQVVWAGSTSVGCGIATCSSGQSNVVVVSCNYSPPGNYSNRYEENVPPLCQ